jgi:hypothetical protein
MTYIDDLDELYRHMQDEVAYLCDISHPLSDTTRHRLVVDRLVYFTRRLCTAMQGVGFPASYTPRYEDYNEHQQVILAEDGIRVVVTVTNRTMYSGVFYTDRTSKLFEYLTHTLPLYREMLAATRRRQAIVTHCRGCHYIDSEVRYCGMGNVLDAECRHHTPMEVVG